MFELDHVFFCPADAARAESALAGFGLDFSRRGVHRGQGTRNACAFFDNAYFELLWEGDAEELRSPVVRPLALWERTRWRETGACPIGVSFRPVGGKGADTELPFETWPYRAEYLPRGAFIPIVSEKGRADEPLVFVSLVSCAPATLPAERRPGLVHAGERRTLTGVAVTRPRSAGPLSPGVAWFVARGLLGVREGDGWELELEWDGGHRNRVEELGPGVPVVFRW